MTFLQARTANEVLKAQERRIRLARLKCELVERERAVTLVFRLARQERDAWVTWPARVAALMAADLSAALSGETGAQVTVEVNDPLGNIGFARFNHLLPPFDNAEIRRAAIMAMKQEDYMAGAVGDEKWWQTCYSVYPCGTALENEAGSEVMKTADVEKAREALQAAGYDGTPVVIMQPTDLPLLSAFSLITAEKLRNAGFKVDVQAMDWSTLTSRHTNRGPISEGGWNMFHTQWIGADVSDPMAIAFSGDPEKGWFGWAEDAELEQLRRDYARAQSPEERKEIATKVQERLWAIGASGHLGQFFGPVAYRNNVTGLIKSPVQFFWNLNVEN